MSNECSTERGICHEPSANPCQTGGKEQECNMHEKFLCLADEAWMELLKEKIKAEIEKSGGAKLNALAKLVAETNGRKWQFMILPPKKLLKRKSNTRPAYTKSLTKF